jgi:hypothetical protein
MRLSSRFRICGLCLCGLLIAATPALSQGLQPGTGTYTLPPDSMPSWTVPVLRLVSATHVEPTTGVVLSDNGLVLIPEGFADMGDEIIVLDGGTDIIRHGRPARIEQKFTIEGLQVIAVDGLVRQGVTLAATPLEQDSEILLVAFPPAEQIAEGKPPLRLPATVNIFSDNGLPVLSDDSELPNVTGALLDECGNLAGVSLADDVQSMEPSPATRYQWRDALLKVFTQLDIPLREFDCSGKQTPEPEPVPEEPEPEPETKKPEPEPEEQPAEQTEETVEEIPEPLADEPLIEDPADNEPMPDTLPPFQDKGSGLGIWLWLLAAVLLAGLGYAIHLVRRKEPDPGPEDESAADEGNGPVEVEAADEADDLPPLLDSELVISGELRDGNTFEDACPVSENAINLIIGRGDTDLVISSAAVSRKHVSLNGSFSELTVADLGSSNGTSINGIPCLEGEIMFMEPGDLLVLGDARCTLEIRPRNADQGEEI